MSDDYFGARGFSLLDKLVGGVERIGHGGYGADERGAEEREDEFRRVREEYHDDVTFVDSEFVKGGTDFSRGEVHAGEGVVMMS